MPSICEEKHRAVGACLHQSVDYRSRKDDGEEGEEEKIRPETIAHTR